MFRAYINAAHTELPMHSNNSVPQHAATQCAAVDATMIIARPQRRRTWGSSAHVAAVHATEFGRASYTAHERGLTPRTTRGLDSNAVPRLLRLVALHTCAPLICSVVLAPAGLRLLCRSLTRLPLAPLPLRFRSLSCCCARCWTTARLRACTCRVCVHACALCARARSCRTILPSGAAPWQPDFGPAAQPPANRRRARAPPSNLVGASM